MQTINTSYGNISVPARAAKNQSPGKVIGAKKKGLHSDQALYDMAKSNSKNKKAANGRLRKGNSTSFVRVNMDPNEPVFDQF